MGERSAREPQPDPVERAQHEAEELFGVWEELAFVRDLENADREAIATIYRHTEEPTDELLRSMIYASGVGAMRTDKQRYDTLQQIKKEFGQKYETVTELDRLSILVGRDTDRIAHGQDDSVRQAAVGVIAAVQNEFERPDLSKSEQAAQLLMMCYARVAAGAEGAQIVDFPMLEQLILRVRA